MNIDMSMQVIYSIADYVIYANIEVDLGEYISAIDDTNLKLYYPMRITELSFMWICEELFDNKKADNIEDIIM
jgi:hypothetical protein